MTVGMAGGPRAFGFLGKKRRGCGVKKERRSPWYIYKRYLLIHLRS